MSKAVRVLESLRSGRAGLLLFYGYLVAILLAFVLLGRMAIVNGNQNDSIAAQSNRQCLAIKGATTYWSHVREAVMIRSSDFTRSPAEKRADATLLSALNEVIAAGAPLSCDGGDG